MIDLQFRFLRKWWIKALIVFGVSAFSEILQVFGIGVLIAAFLDIQIFERLIPHWNISPTR